MKKIINTRSIVICAILSILIGSFCIGAGVMKGGDLKYLHIGKDTVSWWPFRMTIGIFQNEMYDDHFVEVGFTDKNGTGSTTDIKDIKSLKIDMNRGDIDIRKGNVNKIELQNIDPSDMKLNNEDGNVNIQVDLPNSTILVSNPKIKITIKEDILDDVNVNLDLGDITFNDVKAKHFDVSNSLGDFKATRIESDEMNVNLDAGDVDIEGMLSNTTTIQNHLGDIKLRIDGLKEDYNYKIKNDLGDTSYADATYDFRCDIDNGNQSAMHMLDIKQNLGDIKVSFR